MNFDFEYFADFRFFADHPTSYGTLLSDYRRELQGILSQYYEEGFGCKGATPSQWSCYATSPLALKFCRSIEPPPPAPHSGDGRCTCDRPLREPSPARKAKGAAGEGTSEAIPRFPPPRPEAASLPAKWCDSAKGQ